MTLRFNPAPGWPPVPEGWTPPPGWTPAPHWPVPPPGWELWVEDGPARFAQPGAATVAVPQSNAVVLPPAAPRPGTMPPGGVWGVDQHANHDQAAPWQSGHEAVAAVAAEPTRSRRRGTVAVVVGGVGCLVVAGALFATGVFSSSDDSKEEATAAPTETTDATPTPTKEPKETSEPSPTDTATDDPAPPAPGETGSRDAPLAVGATAVIGDWEVLVEDSDTDAWATVEPEVQDYLREIYAPDDGLSWVMAPATVTYRGADSASTYELHWVYISKSGVAYDRQCMVPGGAGFGSELYTGGSLSARVCVEVLTADADGGVWRVSGFGSTYTKTQAFFASQ